VRGPVGGLVAGAVVGAANAAAAAATDGVGGNLLALSGTFVLLGVAGVTCGWIMDRLRTAEDEVATARAREEVAATLHDGVLQVLAAVQRRAEDPALVELAATQDGELRSWLAGRRDASVAIRDVRARLAGVLATASRRDGLHAELVVLDPPAADPDDLDALAGAVGEALANVARHARATRVTVFCDRDDTGGGALLCTVVDDGVGFDPHSVADGMGMRHSVVERMERVGGTAVVRSAPGRGTEWELRLP